MFFSYDVELAEISFFGVIGDPNMGRIGVEHITEALDALGGRDFKMFLSSPGGEVDVGTDIFNILSRYSGKKTIVVDSIAASMASYILQAADERVVAGNSKFMIHEAWGVSIGPPRVMRKDADITEKYIAGMVPAYAERSNKSPAEILALMEAESWYTGKEIVEAGFADRVEGKAKIPIDKKSLAMWAMKIPDDVTDEVVVEPPKPFARREAAKMAAKAIVV